VLDKRVPIRSVTCRTRPSSVWFDDECRTAKRQLRALERTAARCGRLSDPTPAAAWRDQRRNYMTLLHSKRSSFWTTRLGADQSNRRRLWRSFDELLGRDRAPSNSSTDADSFHRYFDEKVADVRAATAGADAPRSPPLPRLRLPNVFTATPADVIAFIKALPDKHCASDPMPTWLLKKSANSLHRFYVG